MTHNTIARISAFTTDWLSTIAVLTDMDQRGLSRSPSTYTTFLVAAEKSHWSASFQLLKDQGHLLEKPLPTIAAGIRCCCTGSSWSIALLLLENIQIGLQNPQDVNLILPEFEAAISTFVQARRFEIARCQLDRVRRFFFINSKWNGIIIYNNIKLYCNLKIQNKQIMSNSN